MTKGFKIMWTSIISVLILIGALFTGMWFVQQQQTEKIMNYLVHEKNYTEADIAEIETHGPNKATPVSTTVIFKDEPNALYFYRIEEGKVDQYRQVPAIYDFKQEYIHSERKS